MESSAFERFSLPPPIEPNIFPILVSTPRSEPMYVKSLWKAITRPLMYGNTAATTGIKIFPNALAQDTKFARSIRNWLAGIFIVFAISAHAYRVESSITIVLSIALLAWSILETDVCIPRFAAYCCKFATRMLAPYLSTARLIPTNPEDKF